MVPPARPTASDRAATLVAWVRSWRAGLVSVDDAVAAIGDGDAEQVIDREPGHPDVVPLRTGLAALARLPPDAVRLVLPTSGDPRGLPGPGALCTAAIAAGAAALCPPFGLVPEVTTHVSGSGDTWDVVRWRAFGMPPGPGEHIDLDSAEQELLVALQTAADLVNRLDIGHTTPELTAALAALRRPGNDPELPPGYGPRPRRVLARARVVTRIVVLAAADAPGGAVTAHEAAERDAALRPLATAARRAWMAAVNAPLAPPAPG